MHLLKNNQKTRMSKKKEKSAHNLQCPEKNMVHIYKGSVIFTKLYNNAHHFKTNFFIECI